MTSCKYKPCKTCKTIRPFYKLNSEGGNVYECEICGEIWIENIIAGEVRPK